MDDKDIEIALDPLELFDRWMKEAEASEPSDPNAVALATADTGRNAKRSHGADERRRRARILILHQRRESERRRVAPESQSIDVFPLEVAAKAGANRRISDRAPFT